MPAILRRPCSLLPALIGSLLALCPALARADDWPQFGFDASRSSSSPELSGPTFSPVWTHTVGPGPVLATPVVSDGSVLVADGGGTVSALGTQDGIERWHRALADQIGATPTIDHGRITMTTLAGELYSLRLGDGSVQWQRMFGGLNYGSPLLVPGAAPGMPDTVVLPAGVPAMDVWRLDEVSGTPLWQTMHGAIADIIYSSPALIGDQVVIGMNGGRFQALGLDSGATAWKFDAGGVVYLSSPLASGGRVYMFPGDPDGQLFAINAQDGSPVAGFPLAIPLPPPAAGATASRWNVAVSSPAAIGRSIVVQLRQHDLLPAAGGAPPILMREYVAAVDPQTARVRWVHALGSRPIETTNQLPTLNACPTPAGYAGQGGAFVVASSSILPRVTVLDAATGEERWSAALSAPGRSSPVFANGQLYVATDAGALHTFASTWNRPPQPPAHLSPSGGDCVDPQRVAMRWEGASDPDGDALSYQVRIGDPTADDGMMTEATVPAGEATWRMPSGLQPSATYGFAVRSRDARGAWSGWSATARFRADAACAAAVMAATTTTTPTMTMPAATQPPPAAPPMPAAAMTGSLGSDDARPSGAAAGCALAGYQPRAGSHFPLLLVAGVVVLARMRRRRRRDDR